MALRSRHRHGAKCMYAADRHLVKPGPEAGDLLLRRPEAKLQRIETKRKRLIDDLLAGFKPAVAPVCGKRNLHFGHVILSAMKHNTASSLIERSLWRNASSTASTFRNA